MGAPVYLGDEVTAAGFRLAGVDGRTPAPGGERAAFAQARRDAPLVIVSTAVARSLDAESLGEALAATDPLVVLVPDLLGAEPLPDLVAQVRGQLGLLDE